MADQTNTTNSSAAQGQAQAAEMKPGSIASGKGATKPSGAQANAAKEGSVGKAVLLAQAPAVDQVSAQAQTPEQLAQAQAQQQAEEAEEKKKKEKEEAEREAQQEQAKAAESGQGEAKEEQPAKEGDAEAAGGAAAEADGKGQSAEGGASSDGSVNPLYVGLGLLGGGAVIAAAASGGSGSSSSGTAPASTGGSETVTDTTPPAAATLSLASDTGSSASDSVTSNGQMNVTLPADAASWRYSTDGGTTYTAGTGTSFTVPAGTYASGQIVVEVSDAAGNASTSTYSGALTVDATAPDAPTLALADDTGASDSDNITSDGQINVALPTDAASWRYSTDGGTTYTAGTGTSFTVPAGTYASGDIVVEVSDAAGNSSTGSYSGALTIDQTIPVVQSMTAAAAQDQGARLAPSSLLVSPTNGTITLVYDSELDSNNPPPVSAFTVTQGTDLVIASVSVSGSQVVLEVEGLATGALTVRYTDPTAQDDPLAIQDIAGNDAAGFAQGIVADGYIRGAQIYIDANDNGKADPEEMLAGVVTDANGNFFLPADAPSGSIIAVGGVNIDTGVPNTTPLLAPAGATTVNPLTTLVSAVVSKAKAAGQELTADDAAATVAKTLGLDASLNGGSLLSFDPLANNDVTAQKAAAQIATIVGLASAGNEDAATQVVANLADTITNAAQADATATVSLSDASVLAKAVTGVTEDASVSTALADASEAIATSTSLQDITAKQAEFLDKIAPAAPSVTLDATVTNDATSVTATVTLETSKTDGSAVVVNDRLLLVIDGSISDTAVVLDADAIRQGTVEIFLPDRFSADGTYDISAVVIDQAGNRSGFAETVALELDTVAPDAPTIASISTGELVNAADDAMTIRGSAEPGSSVQVQITGLSVLTVAADNTGAWSLQLTNEQLDVLVDGSVSIVAKATDAAGNVGVEVSRDISVDRTAPTLTATIDEVTDSVEPIVGSLEAGEITNDNTPSLAISLSSVLEQGDKVVVYDGSTRLGAAKLVGDTWTFTPTALSNGAHSLRVVVEDAAGNQGGFSAAFEVTVDASVPTATATVSAVVQGGSDLDAGSAVNDTTPTLKGSVSQALEQGEIVVVFSDGQRLGEATLSGTTWSFDVPDALVDGVHEFVAVVEAAGGNSGTASEAFEIVVDTAAPLSPSVSALTKDNVVNASEAGAGVTLTGSAEAGSTVVLTIDGGSDIEVSVSDLGAWSHFLDANALAGFGEGAVTVTAKAVDSAGNESQVTSANFMVDTVADPATIRVSDSEINRADLQSIDQTSITVSGQSEAGGQVLLTLQPGDTRVLAVDQQGDWSYTLSASDIRALGQGVKEISAQTTDEAGNTQTSATTTSFTIDTVAPLLTPFALSDESDTGNKGDGRTNVATPEIVLTAESDVGVEISVNGGDFEALGTGTGTSATFAFPLPLSNGDNTIVVRATDDAGNVTTRTGSFVLDNTAPTLAITTDVDELSIGETAQVTFTFSENPGATFSAADIVVTGGTIGAVQGIGLVRTVTFTPTADLDTSTATFALAGVDVFQDAAGNNGTLTTADSIAFDTRAPSVDGISISSATGAVNTWLNAGDVVSIEVDFSEPVKVTGDPSLKLLVGQTSVDAQYASGSEAEDGVLTFEYTVTAGLLDENGISIDANALSLDGATLVDAFNNAATLESVAVPANVSFKVDSVLATVTTTTFDVDENQTAVGTLAADETVTWSIEGGADAGLFEVNADTGALTLKAGVDYESNFGADKTLDLIVKAVDQAGNETTQAVTVDVLDVNEKPTVVEVANQTAVTDQLFELNLANSFADEDAGTNGALTYAITSGALPQGLSLDAATGVISGTATATASPVSITVTATDGGDLSVSDTFDIGVVAAPVIQSIQVRDSNGEATAGKSGDTLTFTVTLTEAVTVTNETADNTPPAITFAVPGGEDVVASYVSRNDEGTQWVFTGTASSGDGSYSVKSIDLGDWALTGQVSDQPFVEDAVGQADTSFVLDNTSATITGIELSATGAQNNTLNAGDKVTATVTFSEPVTVSGVPALGLTIGQSVVAATYVSGSETGTLLFEYVIQNENSAEGIAIAANAMSLPDGASIVDRAGVVATITNATVSADSALLVDTTTPVAPMIGVVAEDGVINIAESESGFTLSGTSEAGASVSVAIGGGQATQATVTEGQWSYEVAPADVDLLEGGASISVTQTDAAGNTSEASQAQFTLDLVAPDAPLVNTVADDNVVNLAEALAGVVISGTNEAGATVKLYIGSDIVRDATVTGTTWTYTITPEDGDALGEGQVQVEVQQFDAAGNPSERVTKAVTADTTLPTVTTTTFAVDENQTAVGTLAADETVTWSISGGADGALFEVNADTGVLTLTAGVDYESNFGADKTLELTVKAVDQVGNETTQAVTVDVLDVNEKPVLEQSISSQFLLVGQAYSLDLAEFFSDEDSAESANGQLVYAVTSGILPTGLTLTEQGLLSGTVDAVFDPVDITLEVTDGGGLSVSETFSIGAAVKPVLLASALDGVTNFDIRSDIVLNFSENVQAVAGKSIRIVNDGGAGFKGESEVNTFVLDVSDTDVVQIVGGRVTLDPELDLDLANNYHIEIDQGAFVSAQSGLEVDAVDDPVLINFSTVTPGAFDVSLAAISREMDSEGTIVNSSSWLDLSGLGAPSDAAGRPVSVAGGSYVLVTKDYDPEGADQDSGYDGILTDQFYVDLTGFGIDDMIYIDNQSDQANDLSLAQVINDGTVPTEIRFAGNDGLGGYIDLTLAGEASAEVFGSIDQLQSLLGATDPLIVSL